MWNRIAVFTLRNRMGILFAVVLGTLFMGWKASQVQLSYDNKKVIPADDPDYVSYIRFKETFGEDGTVMVIGVKSDKLFTPAFFSDWRQLTLDIDSIDGIERVVSLGNAYELVRDDSVQRFRLKPLCTATVETDSAAKALAEKIGSIPFYNGLFYNASSGATLMAVTLERKKLDSKGRIALVAQVEKRANAFGEKYGTEVHFSGLPYIRTVYSTKVAKELSVFTILSVLMTALFLFIMFRSWVAVGISLVVVFIGLIYTFGLLPLFQYKVTILTGLVPPLIVVIIIQNCIYILNVYHFEVRRHGKKILAMQRVLSKIGLASFITNLTTAVGFGVFAISGSALLDEFSILSATAIFLVYGISMTVFPILVSFLPKPKASQLKHLDRKSMTGVVNWIDKVVFNHRPWIYACSLLIVGFSVWGILKVKSVGFIVDDLPQKDPVLTDLRFFEKEFKGVMPFEIAVDTRKKGGVKSLKTLQKMEKLQRILSQHPEFSKVVSVAEFVKMANQAWYNGDPRRYRIPVLSDVGSITQYLPKEDGQKKRSMLSSMVDSNFQTARISVQMADIGSVEMEKLKKQVQAEVETVFPSSEYTVTLTGTSMIYLKGNDYLIENLIQGLVFALILISLMNASMFFNLKMIIITLIPNLIPLAFTLGVMGFAGIPLKNSTILVFSVAYGIVVDLTVHFLAKYRVELRKRNWNMIESIHHSIGESGFSMIYTTIILFFGFIIFAFSKFGGTVALGLLTSLSLIIGLLTNLFLLPALLVSLEKSFKKEDLEAGFIELEEE